MYVYDEGMQHALSRTLYCGPVHYKMERIYVSTGAICWRIVELASLMKRKFNFYHHLVHDVDAHFCEGNHMHTVKNHT